MRQFHPLNPLMSVLRRGILFFLVEVLVMGPMLYILPDYIQAAPVVSDGLNCPSVTNDPTASIFTNDPSATPSPLSDAVQETNNPIADNSYTYVDLNTINQSPFANQLVALVKTLGKWDAGTNSWIICSSSAPFLFAGAAQTPNTLKFLETLSLASPKIEFANPIDYYALLGEPCTKYITQGSRTVCDESLDPSGKPKYYDDSIWPNGHWDAPKASAQLLEMLVYLVTPTAQGGAGHEHIKVSQILEQSFDNQQASTHVNPEFAKPATDSTSTTPASALPTSLTTLNLGFLGDGISQSQNNSPIDTAVAALKKVGYSVSTTAEIGASNTTQDWLPSGNIYQNAKAALKLANTNYVSVSLGTYDAKAGVTADHYLQNLQAIVQDLVSSGMRVIISYPPYAPGLGDATNKLLASYQSVINGLPDNQNIFQGDTTAYGYFKANPSLLADGILPSPSGAVALGKLWGQAITIDLPPVGPDSPNTPTTTQATVIHPVDSSSTQQPEDTQNNNAHLYDDQNPENPAKLATALDISEIDTVRVTTRITEQRRLGGNKVNYQYASFPLKVAWQDQAGITQNPPPTSTSLYSSAGIAFSGGLLQMLQQLNLDLSVDPNSVSIHSFGQLSDLVGQSLLSQLISGGSLKGWDLTSTFDQFGRSFIASQLGLLPGSLSKGDTIDELVAQVGQRYAEATLNLAPGSLDGSTADQIYSSMGRRYLEEKMFKVSSGSLQPTDGFPIANHNDILERLGEGRIEAAFHLQPQSLRNEDFSKVRSNGLLNQNIFSDSNATYVDDTLGLTYTPADGANGFTADDFSNPTSSLVGGQMSWAKYRQLVGSRAISSGVGNFGTATSNAYLYAGIPQIGQCYGTLDTCFRNPSSASGTKIDPSLGAFPQVSVVNSNNFIFEFLKNFGVDTSKVFPVGKASLYNSIDFTPTPIYTQSKLDGLSDTVQGNSTAHLLNGVSRIGDQSLPSVNDLIVLALNLANTQENLFLPSNNPIPGETPFTAAFSDRSQADNLAHSQRLFNALQPFLSKLENVQASLRLSEQQQLSSGGLLSANQISAAQTVTNLLGVMHANLSFLENIQHQTNQSGLSLAAGLPGTSTPTIAANGQETSTPIFSKDPMTTLISGDLSVLATIGKYELAKQVTTDPIGQNTLVSQLNSTPLNGVLTNLTKLGISEDNLIGKGFVAGDFQRLFQDNMSRNVFERMGQDVLLQTLWNKDGVKLLSGSSKDPNSGVAAFLRQANQISQNLLFYQSRLQQLQQVAQKITSDSDAGAPAITQIKDLLGKGIPNSISAVTTEARQLESLFSAAQKDNAKVQADVTQGRHLLEEIMAGHSLSFNQAANGGGSGGSQASQNCLGTAALRSMFQDPSHSFSKTSLDTASCELDNTLNLPSGSLMSWVQNGKADGYSYDSLLLAIGHTQDPKLADPAAKKLGQSILETRALGTLLSKIPGFGSLTKEYQITPQMLHQLLQGNGQAVLEVIGGSALDKALHWKPGTAKNMINPTCLDDQKNVVHCTQQSADTIRLQYLAQEGLKQLGVVLNFPAGFDITQGGNLISNFGQSQLSNSLGLTQNSFHGSYADVRKANDPRVLLTSFGLSSEPFILRMNQLRNNFSNASGQLTTEEAITAQNLSANLKDGIDTRSNLLLDTLADPHAPFWTTPPDGEGLHSLADSANSQYLTLLQSLQSYLQANPAPTLSSLLAPYLAEAQNTSWAGTYSQAYQQLATSFISTLGNLETTNKLNPGSYKQFILGQTSADTLNQKVGTFGLESKLADSFVNQFISKDAHPELYAVLTDLNQFAHADGLCDSKQNMTLQNLILGGSGSCSINGLGKADLSTLFNPTNKAGRTFLYDHLLSRIVGAGLDQQLGFEPGTMRNLFLNPRQAEAIAVSEGLQILNKSILQVDAGDSQVVAGLKTAINQAYLAGFYDVKTNQYTYFNSQRSMYAFASYIDNALIPQFLNKYTGTYLGIDLSLGDVHRLESGDPSAFLYLALQRFAFTQNQTLRKLDPSTHPNAAAFAISYGTVREAAGLTPLPGDTSDALFTNVQANFLRTNSPECITSLTLCAEVPDSQLVKQHANDTLGLAASQIGNQGVTGFQQLLRKQAQARLEYSALDIAAYQLDPHIPPGLAQALLGGTQQQRVNMVGIYAISSLNIDKSIFKDFLTPTQIDNLINFFGDAKNVQKQQAVQGAALNGLGAWASQQFDKVFKINLPPSLMTSFAAWASTGFDPHQFTGRINGGAFNGTQSLGTALGNWGEQQLFSWGDKAFSLPPGSIQNLYLTIQSASKLSTVAGGVQIMDAFISTFFPPEAFSGLESILGLVPGTGLAMVEMTIGLVAGGPINPITLAIFIGMNLFGVYNTKIDQSATADGYYPYRGGYGTLGGNPADQYPSPDPQIGEFNPADTTSYHAGLMRSAQAKVRSVLGDLLLMPSKWAPVVGVDPHQLWVPQVYTAHLDDLLQLDYLISRPAPWASVNPDWGYGPASDRSTPSIDPLTGQVVGIPNGQRAGLFASSLFIDHIHVRW